MSTIPKELDLTMDTQRQRSSITFSSVSHVIGKILSRSQSQFSMLSENTQDGLEQAVLNDDTAQLNEMAQEDVNILDAAATLCIQHNKQDFLEGILKTGQESGVNWSNLLHLAVEVGSYGCSKVLLEYSFSANKWDSEGLETPLHVAARRNDLKCFQLLHLEASFKDMI